MYGEHIPLEGRLMAIADVYDAIISKRPYKDSMLPSKAAEIILEGSGTHFDPALVNVFREVAPEFARTAWKYAAGESERWPGEVTRGLVCDVPPACATAIA
jgi:putative two-component system response regulator